MQNLPVSKQPALRQAIPQAAIIPILLSPHFKAIPIASSHFSARTKLSHKARKLDMLIESIGNKDSQPLLTTAFMISACSRIFKQSAFPS